MGCFESKERTMMEDGGMKAKNALVGRVTTRRSKFRVLENAWNVCKEDLHDFPVKDDSGDPWVTIQTVPGEKYQDMLGFTHESPVKKVVLVDVRKNKPLVLLEQIPSQYNFNIFTFAPNKPGQESTGTHDGMQIFKFSNIIAEGYMNTAFIYSRYDGNDDGPPLWHVEKGVKLSDTNEKYPWYTFIPSNDDDLKLAEVEKDSCLPYGEGIKNMWGTLIFPNKTFDIVCVPGIDPVEVISICVIMEKCRSDERDSGGDCGAGGD
jgi:hypothetical protein